jgi:hypothetical protein
MPLGLGGRGLGLELEAQEQEDNARWREGGIDGQMCHVRWVARKTALKNTIRIRNDTVGLVSVPTRYVRSVVHGSQCWHGHDKDNGPARA